MATHNNVIRKNQCDRCKKPFPIDYRDSIACYSEQVTHKVYSPVTFVKNKMILHDIADIINKIKPYEIVCQNCND